MACHKKECEMKRGIAKKSVGTRYNTLEADTTSRKSTEHVPILEASITMMKAKRKHEHTGGRHRTGREIKASIILPRLGKHVEGRKDEDFMNLMTLNRFEG